MGRYNAFGSDSRKTINSTLADWWGMDWRDYSLPKPGLSREKNLVLILLAILAAVLLWNTFWWLMRIVLFLVIVYIIYQVLKHYI